MFWNLLLLALARKTDTRPRKQDMRYSWTIKR